MTRARPFTRLSVRPFVRLVAPLLVALLLPLLFAGPAQAYVYSTREQLLAAFFPAPTEVVARRFAPDAERLRAALGYAPPKESWEIHVGRQAGAVSGYAVFDQQLGQHEPIDFAVWLDAAGRVGRVEVMVYREPYGDGVRAAAFRRQFEGLGPESPMRPGREIKVVSGSTISTQALSVGVRRAAVLVELLRAEGA